MKIRNIILILLSVVILYFVFFYIPNNTTNTTDKTVKLAVTIFPLKDIVKNVVGSDVEIVQLMPTGASPHTYNLTPKQLLEMKDVSVLFYIGKGLDDWIVEHFKDQGINLVEVSADINFIKDGDVVNPHYWLNYDNAKIISKNILNAIIQYEPRISALKMSDNLSTWLKDLDSSYVFAQEQLALAPNEKKNIITFHDAWGYFAQSLGLTVVAEFEPFPGKLPTAEYLANLRKVAFENNIWTIYSEPQLSDDPLKSFITDLGMNLKILDPLGGEVQTDTFIKLMEFNVSQIIK